MNLRKINNKDIAEIKSIYFNSINSIDSKFYTKKQKIAWASQAWTNPEFDKILIEGKGWAIDKENSLVTFGIRYPRGRLALFYSKGEWQKKGFGSTVLKKIESDAIDDNVKILTTEASLISYKLLLKNNWEIIRKEKIIINETSFTRYRMFKNL